MEKEELTINKDNYKGYVELYKARVNLTKEEKDSIKRLGKNTLIAFFGILLALIITAPFESLLLITSLIRKIELFVFAVAETTFLIRYAKETKHYAKKKDNEIKEKYPYVDTEIETYQLSKSLEKAKIITYDSEDELGFEKRVKEYENYLKAEEIKEKYFEETKYNSYIINPEIQPQELEKPKVKKLIR